MAVSEEFVNQLRQVFEVCDVENRGTISIAHLLQLAGEHFGSSQNSVTSAVASLGVNGDSITFPQFCEVVATILTSHGSSTEVVAGGGGGGGGGSEKEEDLVDGIPHSTPKRPAESVGSGRRRKYGYLEASSASPISLGVERMPGDDRGSPSSLTDLDSALGGSTTSPDSTRKTHSGCSSMSDREEENFECYGEADDIECDSDSARMGDDLDGSIRSPPHSLPPSNFSRRNSWVRRSLRGSPSSAQEKIIPPRRWASFRHAPKRVGGTAVASQLYRTSSFSSGRSSAADQEDMYSDASLEDDVLDLNHKVQMLQQQVGVLAENQVNSDDRFSRVKQDNAAYHERVVMLEEQLRETELRHEDRHAEEQRRNRELITRIEREKELIIENISIKLTSVEKDNTAIDNECKRFKSQVEKLQKDKELLEDWASEAEFSASALHQENSKLAELSRREKEEMKVERERSAQVIEELRCEIERLRTAEETARKRSPSVDPQTTQSAELQATIRQLREENKNLVEQVEDLQAQLLTTRLEEGRTLVTATNNNSLAAEFEAMTSEEGALYGSDTVEKLKKSLKDSQEANQHLRAYIDGILLNIVENYPQLLEVKQK
ncbi:rab11 family-interacting protein 4-like isoform X2 [Homarus americanus]|uniref:rab11 family-interacting protein 4-like isoform X2 n=1 Tax=Homarus americanus TaxID=6706 RepID=UPI001C47EB21|nr:rab11 family-interacting protein 4-like isoform X2 [Homarus americanus]